LVKSYSAIRRTQNIADKLVLGHQHMYAELTRASLVKIFEILKWNCDLDCNSVFADLGCGLGKVVFLASLYGVKKSIGVEVVPQHVENARNSMKKLKAENVEFIEGDIKDHLHKLSKVTHLYAFDFLFSEETMNVIYDFLRMHKGIFVVSFRKPKEMLNQRLNVKVIHKVKGNMTHVSESHNCYMYKVV
jgi:predicted RNA methylase